MLDLAFVRENPDAVREGIRNKGEKGADLDALLEADGRRRALLAEFEKLRHRQREAGREIAHRPLTITSMTPPAGVTPYIDFIKKMMDAHSNTGGKH